MSPLESQSFACVVSSRQRQTRPLCRHRFLNTFSIAFVDSDDTCNVLGTFNPTGLLWGVPALGCLRNRVIVWPIPMVFFASLASLTAVPLENNMELIAGLELTSDASPEWNR